MVKDFNLEVKQRLDSKIRRNDRLAELIHYNKIPFESYRLMMKRGLLSDEFGGDWLLINQRVLEIYMSILAKYLAKIDQNSMVVGTDRYTNLYTAYNRAHFQSTNGKMCLVTALENILPTPNPDIPLSDLIDFRQERSDELLHFRQEIDLFEKQLSACNEYNEIKMVVTQFREKIEREIKSLDKLLRENKIEFHLSSLRSLINLSVPSSLLLMGDFFGKLPSWLTGLGIGVNGAIVIGTSYMNNKYKCDKEVENSGFAYLYHASRQGLYKDVFEWM